MVSHTVVSHTQEDYSKVLSYLVLSRHSIVKKGFESVIIAVAQSSKSKINSNWVLSNIDSTLDIVNLPKGGDSRIESRKEDTIYFLAVHEYSRIGRGRHLPARYFDENPLLSLIDAPCKESLNSITVDYCGNIAGCCGLKVQGNTMTVIGNINQGSIVNQFEKGSNDVTLRILREKGPRYLLNKLLCWNPSLKVRGRYGSMCEICDDISINTEAKEILQEHTEELKAILDNS